MAYLSKYLSKLSSKINSAFNKTNLSQTELLNVQNLIDTYKNYAEKNNDTKFLDKYFEFEDILSQKKNLSDINDILKQIDSKQGDLKAQINLYDSLVKKYQGINDTANTEKYSKVLAQLQIQYYESTENSLEGNFDLLSDLYNEIIKIAKDNQFLNVLNTYSLKLEKLKIKNSAVQDNSYITVEQKLSNYKSEINSLNNKMADESNQELLSEYETLKDQYYNAIETLISGNVNLSIDTLQSMMGLSNKLDIKINTILNSRIKELPNLKSSNYENLIKSTKLNNYLNNIENNIKILGLLGKDTTNQESMKDIIQAYINLQNLQAPSSENNLLLEDYLSEKISLYKKIGLDYTSLQNQMDELKDQMSYSEKVQSLADLNSLISSANNDISKKMVLMSEYYTQFNSLYKEAITSGYNLDTSNYIKNMNDYIKTLESSYKNLSLVSDKEDNINLRIKLLSDSLVNRKIEVGQLYTQLYELSGTSLDNYINEYKKLVDQGLIEQSKSVLDKIQNIYNDALDNLKAQPLNTENFQSVYNKVKNYIPDLDTFDNIILNVEGTMIDAILNQYKVAPLQYNSSLSSLVENLLKSNKLTDEISNKIIKYYEDSYQGMVLSENKQDILRDEMNFLENSQSKNTEQLAGIITRMYDDIFKQFEQLKDKNLVNTNVFSSLTDSIKSRFTDYMKNLNPFNISSEISDFMKSYINEGFMNQEDYDSMIQNLKLEKYPSYLDSLKSTKAIYMDELNNYVNFLENFRSTDTEVMTTVNKTLGKAKSEYSALKNEMTQQEILQSIDELSQKMNKSADDISNLISYYNKLTNLTTDQRDAIEKLNKELLVKNAQAYSTIDTSNYNQIIDALNNLTYDTSKYGNVQEIDELAKKIANSAMENLSNFSIEQQTKLLTKFSNYFTDNTYLTKLYEMQAKNVKKNIKGLNLNYSYIEDLFKSLSYDSSKTGQIEEVDNTLKDLANKVVSLLSDQTYKIQYQYLQLINRYLKSSDFTALEDIAKKLSSAESSLSEAMSISFSGDSSKIISSYSTKLETLYNSLDNAVYDKNLWNKINSKINETINSLITDFKTFDTSSMNEAISLIKKYATEAQKETFDINQNPDIFADDISFISDYYGKVYDSLKKAKENLSKISDQKTNKNYEISESNINDIVLNNYVYSNKKISNAVQKEIQITQDNIDNEIDALEQNLLALEQAKEDMESQDESSDYINQINSQMDILTDNLKYLKAIKINADSYTKSLDNVQSIVEDLFNILGGVDISKAYSWLKTGITTFNTVKDLLGQINDLSTQLKDASDETAETIKKAIEGDYVEAIVLAATAVLNIISEITNALSEINDKVSEAEKNINESSYSVTDALGSRQEEYAAMTMSSSEYKSLLKKYKSLLTKQSLLSFFGISDSDIDDEIDDLEEKLEDAATNILDFYSLGVDDILDDIKSAFDDYSTYSDFIDNFETSLKTAIKNALIQNFVDTFIIDKFMEQFETLWDEYTSGEMNMGTLLSDVYSLFEDLMDNSKLEEFVELIKEYFPELTGTVTTAADEISSTLTESTGNKIVGVFNTMNENMVTFMNMVESLEIGTKLDTINTNVLGIYNKLNGIIDVNVVSTSENGRNYGQTS